VPIIFMTGLTETEHVVKGFEVGGNDYVIKPLQPREVIARIEAQLRSANLISLAKTASEAAAHAVIVLDPDGMPIWKTSKAEQWMATYFPDQDQNQDRDRPGAGLPGPLQQWVSRHLNASADQPVLPLLVQRQGATLHVEFGRGERSGDLLLRFEEHIDAQPDMLALASYQLTPREHDVLVWLSKGKTNRDIADILGISPRTVNKHLEHIFVKLGVETRSAAAALALNKGRTG
jgi:DNA-binding CsgD family transcriptional regulator/CheY-like chemotaxis protein